MIEYKTLIDIQEKKLIKKSFLNLFYTVYERELDEKLWEHQILNSPYGCTPLFLAMDGNKVIGSALMILQKCLIEGIEYNYFLFTTSAILKEYRSKGIYPELLKLQKEYLKKNDVDFIFAFPNKLAYPVLKLFARFKDLEKVDLVKTTFENIDFENIHNNLMIDDNFFNWRFEHKNYLFSKLANKVVIFKEFDNCNDILAVYDIQDFHFEFKNTELDKKKKMIILSSCVKNKDLTEKINVLNATYFPINEKISYDKINVNLLMSDVF